jgi:hypothetical protein
MDILLTAAPESVAVTEKVVAPAVVNVPESNPPVESVKPAGKVEPGVTVQVIAPVPFVAVNWTL